MLLLLRLLALLLLLLLIPSPAAVPPPLPLPPCTSPLRPALPPEACRNARGGRKSSNKGPAADGHTSGASSSSRGSRKAAAAEERSPVMAGQQLHIC